MWLAKTNNLGDRTTVEYSLAIRFRIVPLLKYFSYLYSNSITSISAGSFAGDISNLLEISFRYFKIYNDILPVLPGNSIAILSQVLMVGHFLNFPNSAICLLFTFAIPKVLNMVLDILRQLILRAFLRRYLRIFLRYITCMGR